MGLRDYNREAWGREVERGNEWTVPVGQDVIEAARGGRWGILLTETKPVPRDWFPDLEGADVLCLASGGGQQAPVLAAAGANVTVLDNSPKQLAQYRLVAEREGLELRTAEGDMADLSVFPDGSFDLVFHSRYALPYADATSKSEEEVERQIERGEPLEFNHTLEDQIGGQIDAGFVIAGFYEDRHCDDPIATHMPTYIATRAIK
jgi:SAM-dependent methyltransferase